MCGQISSQSAAFLEISIWLLVNQAIKLILTFMLFFYIVVIKYKSRFCLKKIRFCTCESERCFKTSFLFFAFAIKRHSVENNKWCFLIRRDMDIYFASSWGVLESEIPFSTKLTIRRSCKIQHNTLSSWLVLIRAESLN